MRQLQIIPQTFDDYRADQWFWLEGGRVVQDDGTVWRVRGARVAASEPFVDMSVIDLGPARLVVVESLSAGAMARTQYAPPISFLKSRGAGNGGDRA